MEQPDADHKQAFTICQHALAMVSQSDDWTELGDASRMGHWSNGRFRVILLVPAGSIKGAYVAHVLEVWEGDSQALSACWADPEEAGLIPKRWRFAI